MNLTKLQSLIHGLILYGSAIIAITIGFWFGLIINSLDLVVLAVVLAFLLGGLGSRLSLMYLHSISEKPRRENWKG